LGVLAALGAGCKGSAVGLGSASCTSGCASGLTCFDNADFPGGVCSAACGNGAACASGSACVQLSTGQYCLPSCTSGDGCPSGLVCGTAGSAGRVCLAPAAAPAVAVSCPTLPAASNGGTLNVAEFTGCVQPIVQSTYAPAPPAVGATLSLGVHQVGQAVQFQLPPGTSGFTVVAQGQSTNVFQVNAFGSVFPNSPVPTPIVAPDGTTFFDLPTSFESAPSDRMLTWSAVSPVTAAVTFPNGTAGLRRAADGLTPGDWNLTVSDLLHECGALQCGDADSGSTANSYDMTVLTRSGGIPPRGALDLAIYLVDGRVSAANAVDDPSYQRMLQRVTADLARGGVCVQAITYYDVPAWAQGRWALVEVGSARTSDPCSDYRQLFTLARPGNVVSIFLVPQITDLDAAVGNRTVGYDGAIPGVSTFSGTTAGGAIASGADLHDPSGCGGSFSIDCGPDVVGETVAHEVSHALGLFHTTENLGASSEDFDPLTDTPECLCSLCVPASARSGCAAPQGGSGGTTTVDGTSCSQGTQACGGADYLMFWTLSAKSAGNLSPQEGQVMRMNPLVRPR